MNCDALVDLVRQERLELMLRAPFYGRILCSTEIVFVRDPQVRIACTDYRHIFLSADSYPELPEGERLAVLAHEVLHIALRQAFRIGSREPNRFSVATDIEIHLLLRDTFPEPYDVPRKSDWGGLTAEQIYELLPENENRQAPSDHCYPGDQKENLQGTPAPEKGDGLPQPKEGTKAPGAESGSLEETEALEADGTEDAGECISEFRPQFDADSEMDCRMLIEETRMDMKRGRGRGNAPAGLDVLLEKLSKPQVNWRVQLRSFLRVCRGGSYCWLPPNRRFVARSIYLPGRRDKTFCGVVALDTSGSTMDLLSEFVTELTGLLHAFGKFELTVIECDAEIQHVWEISQYDRKPDFATHRVKGGGGTDFTPVFKYIRKNVREPNVLIFFTDGDGECPAQRPPYPVLWLLTDDGEAPVSWGKTIYYREA